MLCQICLDVHAVAGTPCMHVAHVLVEQTLPLFELINKLSNMMPDGMIYKVLAAAYIPTKCSETLTNHVAQICMANCRGYERAYQA